MTLSNRRTRQSRTPQHASPTNASKAAKTLKTFRSHSRFSRRRFLGQTAGAGLLLTIQPDFGKAQAEIAEPPVLFFNLSREAAAGAAEPHRRNSRHFLTHGGERYELHTVHPGSDVLARARRSNAFLQAVPEDQITHWLPHPAFASDITPLGYIMTPIDEQAGTWSMESVVQFLPASGAQRAYTHARQLTPDGPLPLSAKREFYGIATAASSAQDLADEFALVDYTDAARTLVALQPDLLCANPAGADDIAVNYISNNQTTFLAGILRMQGPAEPQQTPDQQNARGWATLIPLNQDDGTPFKMTDGFNQYFPDWSSQVDRQVSISVRTASQKVKDDESLGADITDLVPDDGVFGDTIDPAIQQSLTGKIWYRHNGVTAVDHGSAAYANGLAPMWDFRQKNGETGLAVTQPKISLLPGDRVQVTFNNVANWFLRFLGVYLEFVDREGRVISKSELPPDTLPDTDASLNLDRGNALCGGVMGPVYSIAGIPIYPPGNVSIVVNLPPTAAVINVFYGGMGGSGSLIGPAGITDVGVGLTSAVNYGLVALFMAAGVSTISVTIKQLVPLAQAIAAQIISLFGSAAGSTTPTLVQSLNVMRGLLQAFGGQGLTMLLTAILMRMTEAQVINSVPVAGQIARAAAAIIGVLQLAVTSIEVGISPPVYQFELTFTHNFSLNMRPDKNSGSFPQLPSGYILYYKVNYLFDNGSPHFLDHVDVTDPNVGMIPVNLGRIPWGGQVNVSVGFYSRKESTDPSENDWCAAKGTTGLVSNTVDTADDIVLEQFTVPIQKETVYIHTSKITLDAEGRHRWTKTSVAPPYVPPSAGQQPGNIANFRSITVRQATSVNQGYVGYSWQSYSSEVLACQTGSRGQLDQAANLNTDMGNNGANAQNGYAITPCGSQGDATSGVKLSYSLLSQRRANFYLDTSSLMLREVQLEPVPEFADPLAGRSFGKLNLASTMLLLHPSGHLVSINNANNTIQALHLPGTAMEDPVAARRFLARTYSGQGSRPGLITKPVAACVTPEGVILVLEDGSANNRIQAFDLGGNPVAYFSKQPAPYFLQLPATYGATYLDIAAEFSGFIYVLSSSSTPPVFRLDIYHPGQSDTKPICTTMGMNAARLTVDFWRNVYTLNYEVLKLPSGQIPARTEPSLSFWVPPPPTI